MYYLIDKDNNGDVIKRVMEKFDYKNTAKGNNWRDEYKALYKDYGWDYLFRGNTVFNNLNNTVQYMPTWLKKLVLNKRIKTKNVNIYDIPFRLKGRPYLNHYPNTSCISNKINLLNTLTEYLLSKNRLKDIFKILPVTFNLNDKVDRKGFAKYRSLYPEKIFLYKPENLSQGKGIQYIGPGQDITNLDNGVIQEYMTNPALFKGCKYDCRVLGLIVGHGKSKKYYFCPHSFVRLASYEYTPSFDIPNWEYVHLTNNSLQKYAPDYGKYEEGNTALNEDVGIDEDIIIQWLDIVRTVFKASEKHIGYDTRYKPFEVIGFDFLILDDGTTKLLEVNDNPKVGDWGNKRVDALSKKITEEMTYLTINKPPGSRGAKLSSSRTKLKYWIEI
jgi:hypothetical protein